MTPQARADELFAARAADREAEARRAEALRPGIGAYHATMTVLIGMDRTMCASQAHREYRASLEAASEGARFIARHPSHFPVAGMADAQPGISALNHKLAFGSTRKVA